MVLSACSPPSWTRMWRSRRTWGSPAPPGSGILKQFDAYCAEHDRMVFDQDTVEGWVVAQLERSGRYRSWMSYIRDFGRWLQANGASDAYVLSEAWKAPFVPAHPYLLSGHEIDLFFKTAAASKSPPRGGGRRPRSSR